MSSAGPYTIEIRAFAPWSNFGEMVPGWASPFNSDGSFHGDARGFSPENDSARLHFSATVDPVSGTISDPKAYADQTVGPFMLFGARTSDTAVPRFDVQSRQTADGAQFVFHVTGSNPLVPFSPDIDVRVQVDLVREGTGALGVVTKLSGDGFPAIEVGIRDPTNQSVFLAGSMPLSKGDIATMLFGDADRHLGQSKVLFNIGENGHFASIVTGALGTGARSTAMETTAGAPTSIDDWNSHAMGGNFARGHSTWNRSRRLYA